MLHMYMRHQSVHVGWCNVRRSHLVSKHGPINDISDGIHIACSSRLEFLIHLDAAPLIQLNACAFQTKPFIEGPPTCA